MPRILVIDDEKLIRWSLERDLAKHGHVVRVADSAEEGLRALRDEPADLVLLDFKLPGRSGLEVLPDIKQLNPQTQVILMSAHGGVETAVAAMKSGAFHYVHKPFNTDELHLMVSKALETARLRGELTRIKGEHDQRLEDFVGDSPAIVNTRSIARRAAESPASMILLQGESGTGKDLLARIVHSISDRREDPFLSINCSALPEHLLESELFGHEKGAFTDAKQAKRGLFEVVGSGTIYLDEIGDMMPSLQAKLLSVLESRRFRRLGATSEMRLDARVIVATNRDLAASVKAGTFREDLFYRLNVLPIHLPPLRERGRDVILLAERFLLALASEYRRPMRSFTPGAEEVLIQHRWPGNVRELRNVIERVAIMESVEQVDVPHLPKDLLPEGGGIPERRRYFRLPPDGISLDLFEQDMLKQAMTMADGNQTKAARLLGLSRDALRYRLAKWEKTDSDESG